MDTLGVRIRDARKRLGLSQEELAERAGVQRLQIVRWEKDENRPTVDNLPGLAHALQVSFGYLLLGQDEQAVTEPGDVRIQRLERKVDQLLELVQGTRPSVSAGRIPTEPPPRVTSPPLATELPPPLPRAGTPLEDHPHPVDQEHSAPPSTIPDSAFEWLLRATAPLTQAQKLARLLDGARRRFRVSVETLAKQVKRPKNPESKGWAPGAVERVLRGEDLPVIVEMRGSALPLGNIPEVSLRELGFVAEALGFTTNANSQLVEWRVPDWLDKKPRNWNGQAEMTKLETEIR